MSLVQPSDKMKPRLSYISFLFVLAVGLFASCSKDEAEIIPRGKLAKIYEEMLMTDQWIIKTPGVRMIADTSLVYEPILEKYGYTKEDYLATVDHYMNDPERFSRILRSTANHLEHRYKVLTRRKAEHEAAKAAAEAIKALDYIIPEKEMIYLFKEPFVHYYDSLTVSLDTLKAIYQFTDTPTSDTTYKGVRMIIKESVKDTLDSLDIKPDTLSVKEDSILVRQGLQQLEATPIYGIIEDKESLEQ